MDHNSLNLLEFCKQEYALLKTKKINNRFFKQAFKVKPQREGFFKIISNKIKNKKPPKVDSTTLEALKKINFYCKNKSYKKALNLINKTVDLYKLEGKCHLQKSHCLIGLKQYSEAIETLQKAIELNGNDHFYYALYHEIANCHLAIANYEKAEEFYDYALELESHKENILSSPKLTISYEKGTNLINPKLPSTKLYTSKARVLKYIGKYQEAIQNIQLALKEDKNNSDAYLLLAQIYDLKGNDKLFIHNLNFAAKLHNIVAIKYLEILKKYDISNLKKDLDYCYTLVFKENNYKKAEKLALQIYDQGLSDIKLYLCLSAIYSHKKKWEESEIYAIYGLGLDSKNIQLLHYLGIAKCRKKDISTGLNYLLEAKKLGDKKAIKSYDYWSSLTS